MAVNILHNAVVTGGLKVGSSIRDTTDTDTGFDLPGGNIINMVCGNTTRASVTATAFNIEVPAVANNTLELNNGLIDINQSQGTSGQILSSLGAGNGVDWIDAPSGGGGGSMDDWIIDADAGLGWPHTVTDGDTVTIAGGTNISTAGSVSGNTVTINQDQYYQTFHFNTSDKNTGGTYYMEWDSAGAQSSLNQQCQYIPLRNGDFTKIKWFSNVAVSGNITMTLYNNTTSLWTSGNFTSSANTAVNFTPNVAISENQRLNLRVVYPSGYGGGFNITAEFAWDL